MNSGLQISKILIVAFMFFFLIEMAEAAKIGVIINFSNNVYKECIDIEEGVSAYGLLNKLNLSVVWSAKGIYGHALCKINGIGEEASGVNCKWRIEYWILYITQDNKWLYSPVGFDGGGCWNRNALSFGGHYCTEDKDVIGLIHGKYGTKPDFYSYEDICLNQSSLQEDASKGKEAAIQSEIQKDKFLKDKNLIFIILSGIILLIVIFLMIIINSRKH